MRVPELGFHYRLSRYLRLHPRLRRVVAALEVPARTLCLMRPLGAFSLRLAAHLGDDPALQRRVSGFLRRRGVRTLGLYGDGSAARTLVQLCAAQGFEVRFWVNDACVDREVDGVRIYHSSRRDLPEADAVIACAPAQQPMRAYAAARAARISLSAPVYTLFEIFGPWAPRRARRRGYQYLRHLDPSCYPAELQRWYRAHTGQELKLEAPQTLSAKIQWLKLYGMGRLQHELTDKDRVKLWIRERLGPEHVLPTLARWEHTGEMAADWDRLPERFVLKCTHGSGMTIFIDRRARIELSAIVRRLEGWLSTDYAFCTGFEMQYHGLRPFIIAERLASRSRGRPIITYRVWCFGGRPHLVEVCEGQESMLCVDVHGQVMPLRRLTAQSSRTRAHPPRRQRLPGLQEERLRRLLGMCRRLCAGQRLPLVRLDFVLRDGRWCFWDLTFSPDSGLTQWSDPLADRSLGELLVLPRAAASAAVTSVRTGEQAG